MKLMFFRVLNFFYKNLEKSHFVGLLTEKKMGREFFDRGLRVKSNKVAFAYTRIANQ